MCKLKFPDGFWWGAATSGPQTEGSIYKPHDSIMDTWFKEKPEDFFNGVGPEIASDFYHSYNQDIGLLKEIGLNSFRTSIQWSRLIDDLETASVNQAAVDYYNNVIDSCIENNIELVMNLHHFDMPTVLLKKYGGWQSKHVVELFVKFAEKAFLLFGDRVKYWTTFNEPMVIAEAGYMYGFHYPKLHDQGKAAVQIIYNLNLASAKVIRKYREMSLGGQIGNILNLTPAYPKSQNEADLNAAKFADEFFNKIFVVPAVKGEYTTFIVDKLNGDDVIWESTSEELQIIKDNTVDFLGVNYYHPKRVQAKQTQWDSQSAWMPGKYFDEYDMPNKRINPHRGWEIYPQAIYDIAMDMLNNYNEVPWFMSENGMGVEGEEKFENADGSIVDIYRIEFYEEHLSYLHKAIMEGSRCFGFHAWTAFDCWSWNNAYKNRYGFIAVDLETQKRTIKESGYWIKGVSKDNGFEIEE